MENSPLPTDASSTPTTRGNGEPDDSFSCLHLPPIYRRVPSRAPSQIGTLPFATRSPNLRPSPAIPHIALDLLPSHPDTSAFATGIPTRLPHCIESAWKVEFDPRPVGPPQHLLTSRNRLGLFSRQHLRQEFRRAAQAHASFRYSSLPDSLLAAIE